MKTNRKIAFSLVLAICMSAALLIWNPQRTSAESSKQFFWTNKTMGNSKYDVVVYGDSRVYRGFSTEAFLGESDLTCFNFGYSSGSYSKRMLDFCESKLSSKNQPKLVFGITPHSFTQDALKDEQFCQEKDRSSFDVLLRKYKSGLLQRFDPISPKDIFGFSEKRETFHADGWISTHNVAMDTLAGLNSYKKVFTDNPINEKAIEEFMEFVQTQVEKGVEVYAYSPPTMVSMDELEDEISGFDFNKFMERFERAGGEWVNVTRGGYQTYDGSHLTVESTVKLSELLGKEILD